MMAIGSIAHNVQTIGTFNDFTTPEGKSYKFHHSPYLKSNSNGAEIQNAGIVLYYIFTYQF